MTLGDERLDEIGEYLFEYNTGPYVIGPPIPHDIAMRAIHDLWREVRRLRAIVSNEAMLQQAVIEELIRMSKRGGDAQ